MLPQILLVFAFVLTFIATFSPVWLSPGVGPVYLRLHPGCAGVCCWIGSLLFR